MKKQNNKFAWVFTLFLGLGLLAGCAASKTAYSPSGIWEYVVKNTPNGDSNGKMVIAKEGNGYSGNFQTSEYGTIPMRDVILEGNALNSTFNIEGATFNLNGTFEGDTFSGKITSNFGNFDVSADRVQ